MFGNKAHSKESRPHVGLHVDVVKGHNPDETLQGGHSDTCILALGGLTHNLHDEVTLILNR